MISKDEIKRIVTLQKEELKNKELGIKRDLLTKISLNTSHAIILTGIRRCGKSTLLRQLMKKVSVFNYLNFEDPRAEKFELNDFEKLIEAFDEVNGKCNDYFFDEIQNLSQWEKLVRYLLDNNKRCIITGSNALLLNKELATKLTGRYLSYELFPFSYSEKLVLNNQVTSVDEFQDYFFNGGFPEFIRERNIEILQNLFNNIIEKDVIVRYKLKDEKLIKNLTLYLLTHIGKEFSYNNLAKLFKIPSTNSIINYIDYLERCYLLFTLPRFDYSLKKQLVSNKKVYSIDPGFSNSNSVSFSEDKGKVLENIVFLHLRRKFNEIFYFQDEAECDFLIKEKGKITQAIQVCYHLDRENLECELNGLKNAMNTFKLKSGVIVTFDQEDKFGDIKAIPVWKWLLD